MKRKLLTKVKITLKINTDTRWVSILKIWTNVIYGSQRVLPRVLLAEPRGAGTASEAVLLGRGAAQAREEEGGPKEVADEER